MAIGTLALCYNNVQVFRGVVKMRRGKKSFDWINVSLDDTSQFPRDVFF